jgi:hypothetical protein
MRMSFEKPFREDPVRSVDRTAALSKIFLFERYRVRSLIGEMLGVADRTQDGVRDRQLVARQVWQERKRVIATDGLKFSGGKVEFLHALHCLLQWHERIVAAEQNLRHGN